MTEAEWSFDPLVTVPLVLSAGLYAIGVARLWNRAGRGEGVRYWQSACFAGGWLTLVLALMTPLHEMGERLFTAHMIEHELLMAVAAPLLAISRPIGAFLFALPRSWRHWLSRTAGVRWISAPWRWLTRPLDATILHAVAIWVWHIPVLFDATVENETLHRLQHISFLVTALFFWWAIFRSGRRSYGVGAIHVAATMVHTSLLGTLIALSPRLLYTLQTRDAAQFGLTPIEDQQLAGLIMWVPAGTIYAGIALVMIGVWIGSRQHGRDVPSDTPELSRQR